MATVAVLAFFVIRGNWVQLAAAGAFLCVWAIVARTGLVACTRALWRLRMFYLAVPVVHLLAHGQAGLYAAVYDVLSLALMVLAVAVLLSPQGKPCALSDGLTWWCKPLRYIGLPGERFALCVGLTLQWVPWAQESLSHCRGSPSERLAGLARILAAADTPAPAPVEMQYSLKPPLYQWMVPCLLLLGLHLSVRFPVPGLLPS